VGPSSTATGRRLESATRAAFTDAYAINESGQIVGTGFRDGRLQAFLLTPDTTPPDTTIDSGPSAIVQTGDASFTFSSSEPNSTFECSLDGAAFGACSSPQAYNELADGSHTFEVRATDAAGNLDPTPASYTWTVDTAAPSGTVDINGGDAYTNSTTVNLTLNADDPSPGSGVAEMRFSDDGTTWSEWELFATSKTWTVSDSDGEKIVYVQFRDAAGNESATAQDTIGLETVNPTTTHTLSPAPNANGWNNSDVSVTLNATDNGGSGVKEISYSVNGGESVTVQQSSVQIPVTDEGETAISYHATDNAGNAEA